MGYDVVEVCMEDPALVTPSALNAAAAEAGLGVGICGVFGPDRDLSHEDGERRKAGIDYLKQCVDVARAVSSPHVAGPMYSATGKARLLPADERRQQWEWAVHGIREVADYAAVGDVRLAIEPLNRFETDMVNTVEQGLELCAAVDRDNVGLLVDTFHMNIEEKSLATAVKLGGDKIFHVQVSENDRGVPGSGHVPWSEFFDALRQIGYSGQVVVESFLPTVAEIARAVSLWRPVAVSMDALAEDSIAFLRSSLP
jgi:D-psicose/D-tagatose/L-ribulose 3-epimerase